MRDRKSLRLRKYSHFSAIMLVAAAFLSSGKEAAALTADDVLNKMGADERFSYVSGVIDGLAYARWLSDRPDDTGMQCIYSWYYNGEAAKHQLIDTWFERHLDMPVDALLYVLIKRECGE